MARIVLSARPSFTYTPARPSSFLQPLKPVRIPVSTRRRRRRRRRRDGDVRAGDTAERGVRGRSPLLPARRRRLPLPPRLRLDRPLRPRPPPAPRQVGTPAFLNRPVPAYIFSSSSIRLPPPRHRACVRAGGWLPRRAHPTCSTDCAS